MDQEQTCQKHQKDLEYFCIEKSNKSNISFLCQDCINETNFLKKQGQGKVFQFDDLLNQVTKAGETLKTKQNDLKQVIQKFDQFKEKIERYYNSIIFRQIKEEKAFFHGLSQQIRDLQFFANERALLQFQENSSYQKAILNEERENWINFSQEMQNKYKQFTTDMDNLINSQHNRYRFEAYTQYLNQNDCKQNANQIQEKEQTKQIMKLKKFEFKKNKTVDNPALQVPIGQIEIQQVVEPQKNQQISTIQQFQLIQQQKQQQEPGNQQEITQDSIQQIKFKLNKNLFKQLIIENEVIKHILIINRNVQIVASDKDVGLCSHLQTKEKNTINLKKMNNTILDIQLVHPQKILIFTQKLQYQYDLGDLFLTNEKRFEIQIKKNLFAYHDGFLYKYENTTQELIKQQIEKQNTQLRQFVDLPDDMMVVAIKMVGDQLHVGFSNGKIRHYNSNLNRVNEYEIKGEEKGLFRLFYFEQDYCIGVQKTVLYKFVYKSRIVDEIVRTNDLISQCSYLIDHENRKIEIQCLLPNNKVFTYKKKGDEVCRNNKLKYTKISCISACPKFKRFYYGYIEGHLKCVKLQI